MSDLSLPPLSMLSLETDAGCTWPMPDVIGYPAASAAPAAMPCVVEGLNGSRIEGQLVLFDPAHGVLRLRMNHQRRPLPLRLDQFRRLQLTQPLPAPDAGVPCVPVPFT